MDSRSVTDVHFVLEFPRTATGFVLPLRLRPLAAVRLQATGASR